MAVNPALESARLSRSSSNASFPFAQVLTTLRDTFERWTRVAEVRRRLERLDERMLRDVGFDPEEARHEAAKPFWKRYTLVPSAQR